MLCNLESYLFQTPVRCCCASGHLIATTIINLIYFPIFTNEARRLHPRDIDTQYSFTVSVRLVISREMTLTSSRGWGGGGGNSHMKGAEMLVGSFELNPQRRPIRAWPKLFLTPKRDHFKTQTNKKYSSFSRATLNETFTAKCNGVLPRTP